MGNKQAAFTEDQLEDYQDCTYFNRNDILRIHRRFRELNPEMIPFDFKDLKVQPKIKYKYLQKLPELKENPFRRRICETFSADGDGSLTFDDFLHMMSVLCDSAPRKLKAVYAFQIYDFDGDEYLSRGDLKNTLRGVTANELNNKELEFVVDKLLEEADLDKDGRLSFYEFEKVIEGAPEFMKAGQGNAVTHAMSRYVPPGARKGLSSSVQETQRRRLSDIVDNQTHARTHVYEITLKSKHEYTDLPGEAVFPKTCSPTRKETIFKVEFQTVKLQQVLKWFHSIGEKDPDAVLSFPPSLDKGQRRQVHHLAQRTCLGTSSEGFGEERFISVYSVEKAALGVGRVYLTAEEKQKADDIWKMVHNEGSNFLKFSRNEIEEMILADKLDPALKRLWEEKSLLMARELSEKCTISGEEQKHSANQQHSWEKKT